MDPQSLHHLVFIIRAGSVQRGDPFGDGGEDVAGVAGAELDLGEFADRVFRFLKELQKIGNGLAVNLLWRE